MRLFLRWRVPYALLLPALLLLQACDSTTNEPLSETALEDEIAASVAFISSDLEFDTAETVALKSAFDESESLAHEPGFLWRVAARLQASLTEEQRERLMARLETHGAVFGAPGFHFGLEPGFGPQFEHRPGFGPFGRLAAVRAFADYLGLTDEQREAIRQILSDARNALHELRVQHRSGALTDEEFRTAIRQLAEDTKAAWEALLTDEQKALLDELKAEREEAMEDRRQLREEERAAARAVMIEVLGLTEEQITALDALQETVKGLREAFQEMIDAGATREEVRAWAEEVHQDVTDELVSILDQRQLEIFLIHNALSARVGLRFMQIRHDRRMHGRPF